MEAFMGTIMPVGFNYAPRGWMFCNGQTVPIAQNSAMFALLGTMYGGDGQNTFGLPDLRGRTPFGSQAQGPGLQNIVQGEKAGTNNVTVIGNGSVTVSLTAANLPAHTHPATLNLSGVNPVIQVSTAPTGGQQAMASGSSLAQSPTGGAGQANIFTAAPTGSLPLGGTSLSGTGSVTVDANTGGGQPLAAPVTTQAQISIMPPYLGLNYIIAMEGIFPSRN